MSDKKAVRLEHPLSRRLIEEWIPLRETNFDGSVEMAFKYPPKGCHEEFKEIYGFEPRAINPVSPRIRNLHPWSARRPSGVARILTVASLLSPNLDKNKVRELVGINEIPKVTKRPPPSPSPILIYINPKKEIFSDMIQKSTGKHPKDIVVVDPMAGGGSIPLAALRLGLKTIAMEYNPVAYILLKATLEFPAKYGETLYEDLRREVKTLIDYAKNELAKYYPEDVENYIFARGFTCPECSGLIPVIHSTKLRREGPYIKFDFNKDNKVFAVEVVEHKTEFDRLRCPYCARPFSSNEVFGQWFRKHKELLDYALSGDVEKVRSLSTLGTEARACFPCASLRDSTSHSLGASLCRPESS